MGLNEIDLFQKIAEPLTEPRRVGSLLELSRRSGVQEDKLKRFIDKWEGSYRTKLIAICDDDHRLKLADLGGKLLPLAVQWTALTNQRELPAETITVQAHHDVAVSIFPAALPSFFPEVYGGLVQLRIGPLGDSVRKTVANGLASFAIDLAEEGEIVPPAEALGPRLPWILLISDTHRLSDLDDGVSCEVVRNQGRVFLSSMAMANSTVSDFLAGVPLSDRVECCAVQEMVKAGLGVGISLDLQGNQPVAGLTKIALKGVEPAQLRFVLPRRGASVLSEPVQALIAAIRKEMEARFPAPSPAEPADVPSVNGSADKHLLTPEGTSL